MRTILILLATVVFTGVALGVEQTPPFEPGTISHTVRGSETTTRLTLHDVGADPFSAPVVRYVVLPEGADLDEVSLLGSVSGLTVEAGEKMTMRGVSLVPLLITPSEAKDGHEFSRPDRLEIELRHRASDRNADEVPIALRHGRGFFDTYRPLIADGQALLAQATESGSYLIITAPEFADAISPLASWKTEKGFDVKLVTTTQTGSSQQEIRDYVEEEYQSQNPPAYVLLVGDVDRVPSFDYHANVTDHPYAMMDGDDFLPDLHVGRLSVSNEPEAETVVAKILRHDRSPYTDAGTDWFQRGLVVGANYGSDTPVPVSRWCREQMLDIGFSSVDSVYFPPHYGQSGTMLIRAAIDRGVSLVNYRGWAYGTEGWEPPHFTVHDIPTLSNGWKLPVVFSFVCLNNNFAADEPCFGEVWLRAGSATEPKGAVAFIGNGEHWSHTRLNDAAAIGAFSAIHDSGTRQLGEILDAAKMTILTQFPDYLYFDDYGGESVEFYFHIYNLLGDPEMRIWSGAPIAVTVEHPTTIAAGSNFLELTVRDGTFQSPIEGVHIGVSRDGALLGTAWTDADGLAHVEADFGQAGGSVLVTATGANISPYQETIPVETAQSFLAYSGMVLDGDGVANPGETIALTISLTNKGSVAATGIQATVTAPGIDWLEVTDATAQFPNISVGGHAQASDPIVVHLDATAEDGAVARLKLEATAGGAISTSDVELGVSAPALRYASVAIDGDGVAVPGETVELIITVQNDGALPAEASTAVLHTVLDDLVTVADSASTFPAIEMGASGVSESAFRIDLSTEIPTGTSIPMVLSCTMPGGAICETDFSIVVGPSAYYAPLGPDAYGYYAYDNTDTDYPDAAPLYDWIHCSTLYGGSGEKLNIRDNKLVAVDLPFAFTYYGRTYSRITVSDNGWISFDTSNYVDYYNWTMPNTYGNAAQVAPFWDNLDPEKEDLDGFLVGDGIYTYHDTERHLFVVEWSRLANAIPEMEERQSFELLLFDPETYPTPTGDGIIQFQYRRIVNNDTDRMYATIGIEDETESIGLQYTYTNLFPETAAPLSSGLAIRFTTQPARYVPFDLSAFRARAGEGGIVLSWVPIDNRPRGEYRVYRSEKGGESKRIEGISLDPTTRRFVDTQADPDREYDYRLGSLDPVGRETIVGPFRYGGRDHAGYEVALQCKTPNPFRSGLELAYATPTAGHVRLAIYDLSGRRVRTLIDGMVEAGAWNATFDGRDESGRELPSGIYLAKLEVGSERRTLKTILIR